MKRIIIGGIFLGVIAVGVYFIVEQKLVIRNMECRNQYGDCNAEIERDLLEFIGKPYFRAKKDIEEYLTQNNLVSTFSIQLVFPDEIEIELVEEKAMFSLYSRLSSNYANISGAGKVLSWTKISSLPMAAIDEDLPETGAVLEDHEIFALQIIADIYNMYQIDSPILKEDHLEVVVDRSYKVLLPYEGEREAVVGEMIFIINSLNDERIISKMEERADVKFIDLRFKNPVLK